MSAGTLFLIPVPIAEDALYSIPAEVFATTSGLQYYFAENMRTARRWLKKLHPEKNIEPIEFSEIDKHSGADVSIFRKWLSAGNDVGLMSEAGCPAIADPGSNLVSIAHEVGSRVVPLTGPSSLFLALMGSGLGGQRFAFNGYLPVKEPHRAAAIKAYEGRSSREDETEIFIETPYRNDVLLKDIILHCNNKTRLCVAQNLTAQNAFISTATVADWKRKMVPLEKAPAVFLIHA